LFSNKIQVIEHNKGIDFENLKENLDAIEEAYNYLKNDEKINEKDIIIDATGGQKIQSSAAAFSSLAYDRIFIYVSTNTYEIKAFDVIIVKPWISNFSLHF